MEKEEHQASEDSLEADRKFASTTKDKLLYDEYIKAIPDLEDKFALNPNEFDYELEWYNSDPLYFEGNLK